MVDLKVAKSTILKDLITENICMTTNVNGAHCDHSAIGMNVGSLHHTPETKMMCTTYIKTKNML